MYICLITWSEVFVTILLWVIEIEPVGVEGALESEDDESVPVNVDEIDLQIISDAQYDFDSNPESSSSMDEF